MGSPNVEFTSLAALRAEALGEPGQRTFRILVDSGGSSAVMWLEKEQLFQLALAITQLQATLPEEGGAVEPQFQERELMPATSLEFKVGKLVLGHDGSTGRFIIDAHDEEATEHDDPAVRFWGARAQVNGFAEEAIRVCAAGRPLCTLCGGPIEPSGHPCPRTNGHGLLDPKDL